MKRIVISIIIILLILSVKLITIKNYDEINFIVHINSYTEDYKKEGFGFVYKKNNNKYYIVTNAHVIKDSNSIEISNYEKEIKEAKLLNYDEYTDIAVLIVEDLYLKKVKINPKFKINDKVYIKGSTTYDYFVGKKEGTIIEKNKVINVSNSRYNAINIKIDLEEGYSGSPLINSKNEVIGMISLKEDDNAYAIPIDEVLDIASLLEDDKIKRPNLGATFVNTTNIDMINKLKIDVNNIEGTIVANVVSDYPLSASGIKEKSIITKIDNKRVYNIYDLKEELYKHNLGDTIYVEVFYNNEYQVYSVLLDK